MLKTVCIGDMFSKWTVIGLPFENAKDGRLKCKCRCLCTRERDIPVKNLISGLSTQCRPCSQAYRTIDLLGQRFGQRVVLEYVIGDKPDLWRCRCDCGQIAL